jgi:exopolyphosphatase/guanosine-5'-triphosphate,3'-diphosphate pyrophosphatase
MNTDIFAAIDIGSNAIRLLINNIEENATTPDFKKVAYLRVPIRLGDDVFTTGRISRDKEWRLIHAMQGFSHILKAYGVMNYRACATSAMRDAGNGQGIVESIRKASGIHIDIINGREEAEIIYEAGGLGSLMDKKRNYLYVDVGGGSTEIVLYSNQQKVTSNSFQLGTVRMLVDAVKEEEGKRFKSWLKEIAGDSSSLSIIASGGNINKIHKVLEKREREPLYYDDLKRLYDNLKALSYEERIRSYKLNTYRADVIVPALKIFLTISRICKVNEIYVPKIGLSDGIIHRLYYERNQKQ